MLQDQTKKIREEWENKFKKDLWTSDLMGDDIKNQTFEWWFSKIDELLKEQEKKCEHNMIPFTFVGGWGGTLPPPNMKCTKCLLETRF